MFCFHFVTTRAVLVSRIYRVFAIAVYGLELHAMMENALIANLSQWR